MPAQRSRPHRLAVPLFFLLCATVARAGTPVGSDAVNNAGGEPALYESQLRAALGPPIDGTRSLQDAHEVGARACKARGLTLTQIQSARLHTPIFYYGGHSIPGGPAAATVYELESLPWTYALGAVITCQAPPSANAVTRYVTLERRARAWRVVHDDDSFDAATRFAQAREPHALSSIEADIPPRL